MTKSNTTEFPWIAAPLRALAVPVGDLTLDPRNARTHDERNLGAIRRSLAEFGQRLPVVVQKEGMVVRAGNARLAAARELGWSHLAAVIVDEDDVHATAYALADNRTAELAEWDDEVLAELLEELRGVGDDPFDATGFTLEEMDEILERIGDGDHSEGQESNDESDDSVPECPEDPVTEVHQIWQCGKHRIACGNSSDASLVTRLMDGQRADLVFTSPPYAQQRAYGAAKDVVQDWDGMMRSVFHALPAHDSTQVLVNLGLIHRDGEWIDYWSSWIEWMRSNGWRRFGWYVWDQGWGLPGDWNGRYAPSFEFVFHFNRTSIHPNKWIRKDEANIKARYKGQSTFRFPDGSLRDFNSPECSAQENKIPDSVIREYRSVGVKVDHPAVFSVGFAAHAIRSWDGLVYDPFLGSGTTVIAAEREGRTCYGIELDPRYVDVAVKRWENLTGEKATILE